jgi:tetrahydromethanopterin:alpha-L-glutamate ligase
MSGPGDVFSTSPRSVAIMTDETGWHTARLRAALRARGWTSRCIDLADCRFETGSAAHGLVIPGYGRGLPEAVIVRGIAGGSFEQVTLRLGILHALRECGVTVYNDARAIERSVDKSMTAFLLHRAGIATPPTWTMESTAQGLRRLMRESAAGREVVLKPLFGSQGKGLQRLGGATGGRLPDLEPYGAVAHLQRFVPAIGAVGHDWRLLVIGGRVTAAMRREGRGWIHNAAQGARCVGAVAPEPYQQLAVRAAAALGLDYAGVDLIPSDEAADGAVVLEVNGVAAWHKLQRATGIDIAALLVDDLLLRKLPQAQASRAA